MRIFVSDTRPDGRREKIRNTGTKQWADANCNIITGCSHNCRYCYAHGMARQYKRVDDWAAPVVRDGEIRARRRAARVMFPSSHDIEPAFLEPCMAALSKLLAAGKEVLIVSKPHLECVARMCSDLAAYKQTILFRFTIGAFDSTILKFWEPGAPSYEERLACLQHAYHAGYQTSVSAEPMLDAPRAAELFRRLKPFITDKIWFGPMSRPRYCIKEWRDIAAEVQQIIDDQTVDKLLALYEALKDEPKVAWKDSFLAVIAKHVPDHFTAQ